MATYNSNRWDDWMCAALKGDQNAYRLLLTNLRPWLTAYFRKRIHWSIVEDLVQDTLITLHAKRQTFNPNYPFGPWIATIARHRWIDHMRKTVRYVELELDQECPSQEHDRDEYVSHDVKTLLKLIPPSQAEIIEMIKLQEMSVEEVSHTTGHSPSNVKIIVHRGIKKMMAAVEDVRDD